MRYIKYPVSFFVVFFWKIYDIIYMDIQSASVNLSQARVQEDAAVQVQSMIIDAAKEQAVALEKLLASAQPIVAPNLGQNVNILA